MTEGKASGKEPSNPKKKKLVVEESDSTGRAAFDCTWHAVGMDLSMKGKRMCSRIGKVGVIGQDLAK